MTTSEGGGSIRPSMRHCTCCGARDIRQGRRSRWTLPRPDPRKNASMWSAGSFWDPGDLVLFMVCPHCDLLTAR